jgi:hypothetical protein
VTTGIGFCEDAATVLGLAGTAMAFAGSKEEEVDRWLRTLRLYGEAGAMLRAAGIDDAAHAPAPPPQNGSPAAPDDPLASVIACAQHFAGRRSAPAIGTVDLLFAVMQVYGRAFDEALAARGTDRAELVDRLETVSSLSSA